MAKKDSKKNTIATPKFGDAAYKLMIGHLLAHGFKKTNEDEEEISYKGWINDPDTCEMFLRLNNPENRVIKKAGVERIVDSIKHDGWKYTGQCITVGTNGMLGDGQYRIAAIQICGFDKGEKYRVKFTFLKDNEIVKNLYTYAGQQTTLGAEDVLRRYGFTDKAHRPMASVLIQLHRGVIGTTPKKRSTFTLAYAKDYSRALLALAPLTHKRSANITSAMCTIAAVVGRAFKREDEAYQWLERVANYAFMLDSQNKVSNEDVVNLKSDLPERVVAYWLAAGGVSRVENGKRISANGIWSNQNSVAVVGNALIRHFRKQGFTEKQLANVQQHNGWREIIDLVNIEAKKNKVTLFNVKD